MTGSEKVKKKSPNNSKTTNKTKQTETITTTTPSLPKQNKKTDSEIYPDFQLNRC